MGLRYGLEPANCSQQQQALKLVAKCGQSKVKYVILPPTSSSPE